MTKRTVTADPPGQFRHRRLIAPPDGPSHAVSDDGLLDGTKPRRSHPRRSTPRRRRHPQQPGHRPPRRDPYGRADLPLSLHADQVRTGSGYDGVVQSIAGQTP